MQTQHYIVLVGIAFGLALLGYYIRKIILRAFDRHYDAGVRDQKMQLVATLAVLKEDIDSLTKLRQRERGQLADLRAQMKDIKTTPFTSTDYRDLTEITQFLALALQTWKALKGTEASQARAEQLIKVARAMAYRVFHTVETASVLNAQPLDTQLIEWLDKRGTFNADPELSSISFPHNADTHGYAHLRDVLREAYELDTQRQAGDLGMPLPGAAA